MFYNSPSSEETKHWQLLKDWALNSNRKINYEIEKQFIQHRHTEKYQVKLSLNLLFVVLKKALEFRKSCQRYP